MRYRRIISAVLVPGDGDGFVRLELDEGSVLHVSACVEGMHVVVDVG